MWRRKSKGQQAGDWTFTADESDAWRYFRTSSGLQVGWLHPRFDLGRFVFMSKDKVFEGEVADLRFSESHSIHKTFFEKLTQKGGKKIAEGDWEKWQINTDPKGTTAFSREGMVRMVLSRDTCFILGVSCQFFLHERSDAGCMSES